MGSVRGWLAGDWPSTGGVLNITAEAWTAGFHWWRSGNITRTQNVSEYMLVLALCLVQFILYFVSAPSEMVGVSASVNLPLHHKVQKFSSGTGSPGWSRKKDRKTVVVVVCILQFGGGR